ncbi:hypothetical protein MAPG_10891 [Magnaporthiopsis poae ATCC 64411]|uniref:Uncharacterized protein n=1 Tax=Magnaporthiopsis poae (strain ATCC 64411 / 73-15) TaxID=644358 RepID=A0A0C4EDT1_MAGP6|nr:hypothetical protein MAPG_10891 [Magnaporthiopsis poae ATCC 64411]
MARCLRFVLCTANHTKSSSPHVPRKYMVNRTPGHGKPPWDRKRRDAHEKSHLQDLAATRDGFHTSIRTAASGGAALNGRRDSAYLAGVPALRRCHVYAPSTHCKHLPLSVLRGWTAADPDMGTVIASAPFSLWLDVLQLS